MKNEIPRLRKVTVRFNESEYASMKSKSSNARITPSQLIRQSIGTSQVQARLSEEEKDYVRQLSGMANNLNQLTKAMNSDHDYEKVKFSLLELRLKFESLLDKINK
jgi:hypothetical protein